MRKYFAVAAVLFKAQITYRFDVILNAAATIWRVLFAWVLWGAIFNGRGYVGGFTFQAMLSYYVVSSFIGSLDLSQGVSGEISSRIRGGTFSKYMVIPSRPQTHFIFQNFGAGLYYALFTVLAAVFCVAAFRIELNLADSLVSYLCAAAMVPAGLAFMVGYHFLFGVCAFKFEDIGFFWHMQGAVVEFLTGALIPLSLLPEQVTAVLRYLPFTYVNYMPAMLITSRAGAGEGLFGLAVITVWGVLVMTTGQLLYDRLRIKYDGVGI